MHSASKNFFKGFVQSLSRRGQLNSVWLVLYQ